MYHHQQPYTHGPPPPVSPERRSAAFGGGGVDPRKRTHDDYLQQQQPVQHRPNEHQPYAEHHQYVDPAHRGPPADDPYSPAKRHREAVGIDPPPPTVEKPEYILPPALPITVPSYVPPVNLNIHTGFPLHFYPLMIPRESIPTEESTAHSKAETGVRIVNQGAADKQEKKQQQQPSKPSDADSTTPTNKSKSKHTISQQEQLAAIEKYTSVLANASEDDRQIASLAPEPPSKVIHYRNITQEITSDDLIDICSPYGQVNKTLMLRAKNQALIEYNHINSAIRLINNYISTNTNTVIKGKKIYAKFSNHQNLESSTQPNSKVILITYHMPFEPESHGYMMTAEFVYTLAVNYGKVEKIVLMKKNDWQALVQYHSADQAALAHNHLKDKTVYVGLEPNPLDVRLDVYYSHVDELSFRAQAVRTRDYINLPVQGGMWRQYLRCNPDGSPNLSQEQQAALGAAVAPPTAQQPGGRPHIMSAPAQPNHPIAAPG